jgi:septal ring factor EnvC (AmiA/AmiB activator)
LREKTARWYPTEVFPSPLEAVFAEPPASQSPPLESAEAERQRRADEAEPVRRQREAERQALLRADIPALERELSEWTDHREWLARHESPSATGLADRWGELAQAQRAATAAEQALDALEAAYADWRQVHKRGLLLMAGLPGSPRREVPAWEQRLTEARTTLEHAQAALAVAREAYDARLPAAEREARQMAEDRRQQLAALQERIEEQAGLIQRAKAVQEAEREHREAEARTRAEAERPQREAEQRKIQEPERPPAEPPAPKQEPPKWAIPAPRPKPRYPAPGG